MTLRVSFAKDEIDIVLDDSTAETGGGATGGEPSGELSGGGMAERGVAEPVEPETPSDDNAAHEDD